MTEKLAGTALVEVDASNNGLLEIIRGCGGSILIYSAGLERVAKWRILEGICRPPILVMVETERQL